MSDRDKGLINAVRKVFSDIPHSKSLHHLSENFKKVWPTKCRFYNTWQEYQMYLRISRTGEYGEEINSWIHNADPKMCCRSLFPIPRFGITTSNPVEVLFSALRNC